MNATEFKRLNQTWNAEPNSPRPSIRVVGSDLELSFVLNAFAYPGFEEEQIGHLRFHQATKFRMGTTNNEGWYRGRCRFSKLAPAWGEFYEVSGDLLLEQTPDDWVLIGRSAQGRHHYLFYLRDSTFECDADSYEFHPYAPPA